MRLIDNISKLYRSLRRRRRLSVVNPANNREEWFTHISPVGIFSVVISAVLFVVVAVVVLAAYTPLLNIFPEYRTQNERSRLALVEAIVKIDSIESQMLNMIAFNSNLSLIMDGQSPISSSVVQQDSTSASSGVVAASALDALLREEMERSERYNLNYHIQSSSDSRMMVPPVDGVVFRGYDLSKQNYGVSITSSPRATLYASNSGTVLSKIWSPEFGYVVEIIHAKGELTIYRGLSQSLLSKGERVERGEVIGYGGEAESSYPLEFELWIDGKPVNPEHYIDFR